MNPSEAWALLTLRSKDLARSASEHGAMRSSDIAALLAGLEREPFLMGMVAELGDIPSLVHMRNNLWTRARTLSENGGWDPPGLLLRDMVNLAIYEVIDEKRCMACSGSGKMVFSTYEIPELLLSPAFERVNDHLGQVRCIGCMGEGRIAFTERRKAEFFGMKRDTWRRHWARRYESIFAIANGWREIAKGYLAGRVIRESEEGVCAPDLAQQISAPAVPTAGKTEKNRLSCTISKLHARVPPREVVPTANSRPENVDLSPLQRPILSLRR